MYDIHALPSQIDARLIDLLRAAEPATIGHFRNMGFVEPGIRALLPGARIAGTAVTVRYPGADGAMVHYAVGQARAGDVLVIDRCGDRRHATVGGALAYAARAAGLAGIIVDGVVTDIGELRGYGFPVWARGLSAVTVKSLGVAGEFCAPVSCGGVAVSPGDAILADENGILVLPESEIKAVAEKAIKMQHDEKKILARIDAGEKYPDILGTTLLIEKNRA